MEVAEVTRASCLLIEIAQRDIQAHGAVAQSHRIELARRYLEAWIEIHGPLDDVSLTTGLRLRYRFLRSGENPFLIRLPSCFDLAWLAFEERGFEGYRAYYRFVPKGHWSVEYTVRLNNPGTFQLPATRVEAMYAPEMLGELPNAAVTVQPVQQP